MNLITIQNNPIGTETTSVNARELHKALNIVKDFSNWIKAQIKRAGLEENIDYITYHQKGVGGKFDKIDYFITIDSAKHIAMMSQSKQAKAIRNYFIEVEKKYSLHVKDQPLLINQNRVIAEQEKYIKLLEDKRSCEEIEAQNKILHVKLESLKQQNTHYYEEADEVKRKLQQIRNILNT